MVSGIIGSFITPAYTFILSIDNNHILVVVCIALYCVVIVDSSPAI